LQKGVSPAAKDTDDMTALHWAAASGSLNSMRWLLDHGAPLEVRNTWGGTVLDSTGYFAVNSPFPGADYGAVFEILLAAGANPREVSPFPLGIAALDALIEGALNAH
ncbi:MAG: ankyrin repeat domain-containing protein, partial [bacterium]